MRKIWILLFWFIIYAISSCKQPDGQELYAVHCAGCHGFNLEGTTSGSKLSNPLWKNEEGRAFIYATIKFGVPSTMMIGWETLLKEKEIHALADYIVSAQVDQQPHEVNTKTELIKTSDYTLKVEKMVVDNLTTPWAIEFLNRDTALISEKGGSLQWLIKGKLDSCTITGLPKPHLNSFTGGLMDIALDPDFKRNRWVYLSYSHTNGDVNDKSALSMTKIVRGKIKENEWQEEQVLFEVPDSLMVVHGDRWGCRFLFDRQGFLYFTIGDMGKDMDSQKLDKPTGKVFRIHPDGSVPADNPFVNEKGALPAIFTIGNRNTQGMALHPQTGAIWSTDHGPQGGDEVNILTKGANYGWPVITHGIDYNGESVSEKTHQDGMEQPVVFWTPSIAVCPAEFVSSPLFSKWKDDLLVGALAFQQLRRLDIHGENVTDQEILFKGMGRVRDLKFGPNGALYVLTNSPDRLLRITPHKE